MTLQSEPLLGFPVTTSSLDACVEQALAWIRHDARGRYLVCLNPHSTSVAGADHEFSAALRAADIVVPDGVGIVLASRLLRGHVKARIAGNDVVDAVHRRLPEVQRNGVFFLGASEETLDAIRLRMAVLAPGVRIAGSYSPPFRAAFSESETELMIQAVNEARPDVLWVGMTAPKQEKWIAAHRDALEVPFIGAVGAVFDFLAGTSPRSPVLLQRLGLEWAHRLAMEPRRLWRRTFVSAPAFVHAVLRERLRGPQAPTDA